MSIGVLTLHRHSSHHDIVVGDSDGGKDTLTLEGNIERAIVNVVTYNLRRLNGHEPHNGYRGKQHLGVRLFEVLVIRVPSATFNEQSMDKGTIFRFLRGVYTLRVRDDLKVVLDSINRNLILSGIVLFHTSQERVSEMEPRDPETSRMALINPLLIFLKSLHEIDNKGSKGFESVVRPFLPLLRHNVIVESITNFFKFLTHDDFSLDTLLQINERASNGIDKPVVTEKLLRKHSVHRFFVHNGMLLGSLFVIELLRELVQNALG